VASDGRDDGGATMATAPMGAVPIEAGTEVGRYVREILAQSRP
jgi:hypothetical protein